MVSRALVYELDHGSPCPDDRLFCSRTFSHAFEVVGTLANEAEAERYRKSEQPWGFGCDGGNKGTAKNMVAWSDWDPELQKPVASPGSCAELFGDQTAKNCAEAVQLAAERSGRQPELDVHGVSGAYLLTEAGFVETTE